VQKAPRCRYCHFAATFLPSVEVNKCAREETAPPGRRMFDHVEVIFTDSGRQINGDLRAKKHSVTESMHSKTRFSDVGDDEGDDRSV
jgi:hypothetical protein